VANGEQWARLTRTLKGPRDLKHCQSCGISAEPHQEILQVWREHDDEDQPQPLYLVLCARCGDEFIEKHPRLYDTVHRCEPAPGVMPACVDCKHAKDLQCHNPLLKANGGPGLPLNYPPPSRGFIDWRDKAGRRKGSPMTFWHGPVTCRGREE
jgi:hypothetical protein